MVHAERIEECDAAQLRVGAVTARALAPLPKLLELAEPFLEQGAIGYFHKGQDVEAELTEATKSWRITVEKHPSMTDSRGTILVVKEARRVRRQ
jgi:16S rRNA (guanine527-N7)-methyltransferase